MATNTMLRDLQPDTEYTVTVVPIYADVEGKSMSDNGKTSKLIFGHPSPSIQAAVNYYYYFFFKVAFTVQKYCVCGIRNEAEQFVSFPQSHVGHVD